jgi:alkaline phosphatase D
MAFGDIQRRNLVAVGKVGSTSARLWFRAERPGSYVVEVLGPNGTPHGKLVVEIAEGNPSDNTAVVDYPAGANDKPLLPLHRYTFTVGSEDGSVMVGEGRFETAPHTAEQTPEIFSIGAVSCHQPFEPDGSLSVRSMRLLEWLPEVFGRYDIKFLFGLGDQIYADNPGELSLLNPHYLKSRWPDRGDLGSWTPEQIRAAYQERYRICWNQVPWLKLLSTFPNYAILDDHEVFDDWGSNPTLEKPPYTKVIDAARLAYLDYQGGRQLGWNGAGPAAPSFDYSFTYGTVAAFVFDLRSERQVGPPARVIGQGQLDRFKKFLADNAAAHVILVVTSVPLVHIPEWLAAVGEWVVGTKVDFPDQWSAPRNTADRDAVLAAMREHLSARPKQRLIVLGGDVHVGAAFELHFVGGKKPYFFELTTSSVTNRLQGFSVDASLLGPKAFELTPRMAGGTLDVSFLRPAKGAPARNPIGGLNAGIIEFKRKNAEETNVRLKLIGYDDQHNVKEEFTSGWL